MIDYPIKVGLVGYGWFAELLSERVFPFVPELRIAAVCDPLAARREQAKVKFRVPTFDQIETLLASSDCEAVIILTPHNTHRALVEAATAAGRHVFCEKAMAVTVEDCLAMIQAAQTAKVKLLVGHMQKLFPPYARAIELVRSGRYGRPLAINVFGFHWCPVFEGWWRSKVACGGLLYWTGVHDIDTMRAVAEDEVSQVYALAGPKTDNYTDYEDSIAVTLRCEKGAIGTLQVAQHDPLREFNLSFALSVLCEGGSVRYLPEAPTLEHAARFGDRLGERFVESFPSHEENENQAYRLEFAHFARVVRNMETPILTCVDGLRCVEVMQAAYESIALEAPVPLKRAFIP